MPFPIIPVVMAAAALAKNKADADKEARQRQVAAVQQTVSPWSGIEGVAPQESDKVGNLIATGAGSIAQYQAGQEAAKQAELQKQYMEILKDKYSPWSSMSAQNRSDYIV